MKYFCNPLNLPYQYQFCKTKEGQCSVNREAADPSMVLFKGKYYIFPSMTCGFWWSEDLVDWQFHALKDMPVYDYAPDVRPVGDWLYFCASSHVKGTHYRTKDPFSDVYEKIDGAFPFWDPDLFEDEDGRLVLEQFYVYKQKMPVIAEKNFITERTLYRIRKDALQNFQPTDEELRQVEVLLFKNRQKLDRTA